MRKTVISLLSAFAVCLVFAGILLAVKQAFCAGIYDQTAAERWKSGDRNYVQLSVFISSTANAGQHTVNELRAAVNDKLLSESVTAEREGAEVFFDAYSARTYINVSRDKKSFESAAYFTGGDFFRFHSLDIKSGWYYNEYDLMDDCVLINTYAAWQLYGSYDIVGKQVDISGYPCVVYGVFDDSAENSGGEPVIYANYSLLRKLGQQDIPITCYEIVLPELVSNFGENILRESVSISEHECEILKNTGRYSFAKNAKDIGTFLSRTDRNSNVLYPAWENSAKQAETLAIILTFLVLLFSAFPVLLLLFAVILLYANKGKLFRIARDGIIGAVRRHRR